MPTPTVPQEVYQRHEREWQMLREAIAKSQQMDKGVKDDPEIAEDRNGWPSKDMHQ